MKIGILGTGMVGTTIGNKLVALGHEVRLGSRAAGNEKALAWVKQAGARASQGSFADAAGFGELVFNCTPARLVRSTAARRSATLWSPRRGGWSGRNNRYQTQKRRLFTLWLPTGIGAVLRDAPESG